MSRVGPDRVVSTESMRTWEADGAVKLRIEEGDEIKPISIPTFVKQRCTKAGSRTALCVKREGKWKNWTYYDYYADIQKAAKGFIKLGLEPYHGVAIFGFNSPEWFFSSLGAIFAGGFSTGLYPTNSAEMNQYIMNDSQANVLVCEDEAAVDKMWKIISEVPTLKKVVQYSGKPTRPEVLSWTEFMELSNDVDDDDLEDRMKQIAINQCAVLIYTSGTTGNPKGVMLSHDNLLWTTKMATRVTKWKDFEEVYVSYLPLSHIAGMLADIYAMMNVMGTVYFADKTALKGTLLDTLKEVRPTIFFAVPRVWEKFMEGMLDKGKAVKGLKKKIATSCKQAGLEHHMNGKDTTMYKVGQKIFYKKVREALGLDRCWGFFSGAAPLMMDTLKYFLSLDIVILELFGMSETTAPHTINTLDNHRFGSVGKCMPFLKVKLKNPNEDGEGELCVWGRNIMMGYLRREDKTKEDLEEDGWLHTGDMATIDKDNYVYITGRIKELLITAGGENVAPIPVEDRIKSELPIISNAVLIGDKKKFLTVFLTLKTIVDTNTMEPTEKLSPSAVDWCASLGRNVKNVDDILSGPDPVIMAAIQAGIDRTNAHAVSNAARVQKWTILPLDLSIGGGELGPTMKLKRFAFNKKYTSSIDRLYA